jgi:hypothetical protein
MSFCHLTVISSERPKPKFDRYRNSLPKHPKFRFRVEPIPIRNRNELSSRYLYETEMSCRPDTEAEMSCRPDTEAKMSCRPDTKTDNFRSLN